MIEDVAILDTEDLIPTATCKFGVETCLWTRGIIPAQLSLETLSWACNKPKLDLHISSTLASCDPWCGTIYGDASGGKFSAYPELRRVGCGLIMLSSDSNSMALKAAINFNLPGEVHTVPRGELYCILVAVTLAPEDCSIDFVTDNEGNCNKYNKGRDFAVLTANGDLFKQIFLATRLKNISLTVRWMPSHTDETDELPAGVTRRDVVGNNFADIEAGKAALLYEVDLNASSMMLHYRALAGRIQRRIVAILQSLPQRKQFDKPLRIPFRKADLESLFQHSQHVLFFSGDNVCCARCQSSYHIKSPHVRKWMLNDCPNIGDNCDRPRPVPPDFLNIGSKSIHHTHSLNIFKGLIYCRTCGCRAQSGRGSGFIKKLAHQCQPPTDYGKSSIKALHAGKKPPNFGQWPCDREGYGLQHKTVQEPTSDFAKQLIKDKPGLSQAEAMAVGQAMLRCAEFMANIDCNTNTNSDSKLITVKDIAAPPKDGDPNAPASPSTFDMFDYPIGNVKMPSLSEPHVKPYTGGFEFLRKAFESVDIHQTHTVQDMSSLVLDNAQFRGEVMDEQDKQWYTQTLVDNNSNDDIHGNSASASSSSAAVNIIRPEHNVLDNVSSEFADFSSRGRFLSRLTPIEEITDQDSNILAAHDNNVAATSSATNVVVPGHIQAEAQSDFATFSTRGRNLRRMSTEEAIAYFMEQPNASSSSH